MDSKEDAIETLRLARARGYVIFNIANAQIEIDDIEGAIATIQPTGTEYDHSYKHTAVLWNLVKKLVQQGHITKAKDIASSIQMSIQHEQAPLCIAIKFLSLLEVAIAETKQQKVRPA